MAITDTSIRTGADRFQLVAIDLYRDIHKGIRAELFSLTGSTGSLDPADRPGRVAVADHLRSVVDTLVTHAEHEDQWIEPVLQAELPMLATEVHDEHEVLEARMEGLLQLAGEAIDAPAGDERRSVSALYLDLASFTSAYLAHQDKEEQVIMPALDVAIGFEACLGIHQQIVTSIPPDQMAASLAFMIPAMNVDDRTELLGGMQAGAPPEVFAQVWGLVRSVLRPVDAKQLGARLGLEV
jgi:iron-sulfur cluster repair protein YtfE (RIC family)